MLAELRWKAWYGDEYLGLQVPDGWSAGVFPPKGGRDIGLAGIDMALDSPVATPPLEDLAQGRSSAAIAVDDISRPLDASRILPALVRRLERGGISREKITIILGLGCHRPMTRDEIIRKLGVEAVETLDVWNHHPFHNCTKVGVTVRGTPVLVNSLFMEADLRIGVGTILPHPGPGFGGGGKIIFPGIAGFETIQSMHTPGRLGDGIAVLDGNELRTEIETMAVEFAGLEWVADAVTTPERGICGLFTGDPVAAHRKGAEFARGVYATPMPREPVDVAVCSAYPKDTEFVQHSQGLNVLKSRSKQTLKKGGTVVVVTASPEGRGYHSLFGPGMPCGPAPGESKSDYRTIIFSPNLSTFDTGGLPVFSDWGLLVEELERFHGASLSAAFFPCGAMQLAED